jgi:hypothetical protein
MHEISKIELNLFGSTMFKYDLLNKLNNIKLKKIGFSNFLGVKIITAGQIK